MKILDKKQIQQKIKRLAIEILENNFEASKIILAGINNNGVGFAKLLRKELVKISEAEIILAQIKLNPAAPTKTEITISLSAAELKNRSIIIVDDVANTGRTLFYAIKPLLDILPARVEIAVLVDRKHKSFPMQVDYVGLSLATTMNNNIQVDILKTRDWAVHLED